MPCLKLDCLFQLIIKYNRQKTICQSFGYDWSYSRYVVKELSNKILKEALAYGIRRSSLKLAELDIQTFQLFICRYLALPGIIFQRPGDKNYQHQSVFNARIIYYM